MFHGIIFTERPLEDICHHLSTKANQLVFDPKHHHIITKRFLNVWVAQETKFSTISFTEAHHPHHAIIMAWTRLDNMHELIRKHQLNATITPAELILHLYFKLKEDCVKSLLGDFSFAIYDIDAKSLFCARDPMGIKPLYYYHHPLGVAFSTSMRFFHLLGTPTPRLEWVCNKLTHCIQGTSFEETVYHQIYRCLPAHYLKITSNKLEKRRYFHFDHEKIHLKSSNEYVDYYEAHLDMAVRRRANVAHPLGAEQSGGLDSASITAYALQHFAKGRTDFHTFSFALNAKDPEAIFSVNQQYGLSSGYVCCHPLWYLDAPQRASEVFGAPAHHEAAIQCENFYQQAQRLGVRTLLSGFGGDECVTNGNLQLYCYELLANQQYGRLLQAMPGNSLTRVLRMMRFLYLNRGNSGVRDNSVRQSLQTRWPIASIVLPSLIQQYQIKNTYDQLSGFSQGYNNLNDFILDYTLSPSSISARAEESTLMASHYGVEYAFPLLDIELIQCYLSIPSHEKYYRGQKRYLHRRAVTKYLPSSITSRNSKNMGRRITPYNVSAFILNEDLHPALLDILQKEKLWQQSVELKSANTVDLETPLLLQTRHNIHTVNALDTWLKYFYPKGCDWYI
jgi:asparagine synthase (glutamine-hydrolysing)